AVRTGCPPVSGAGVSSMVRTARQRPTRSPRAPLGVHGRAPGLFDGREMTGTDPTREAAPSLTLDWISRPTSAERPAVVTGAFDILHVGHVRYLKSVRARGFPLVVGVESDERVRAWKGPGRPINPAEERA